MINHRFKLENSFQEILYLIDVWINKESGWIVESIECQYTNISNYRPLSGCSYINLPEELKSPKKGLINIKNKDQTCFLWCHVGHINHSKEHPERIKTTEKKLLEILIMIKLSFPCKKKILARLKRKTIYALMCLVMKTSQFFRFIFQIKNLKTQWICCF